MVELTLESLQSERSQDHSFGVPWSYSRHFSSTRSRYSNRDWSTSKLDRDRTLRAVTNPEPHLTNESYDLTSFLSCSYDEGGPGPAITETEDIALSSDARNAHTSLSRALIDNMAGNNINYATLDSPGAGPGRGPPSSPNSVPSQSTNGNGVVNNTNYMAPLPVGHQQDLNYLYGQIQELSGILRSNRERMAVITKNAEEVAKRANGTNGEIEHGPESDQTRLHDLEHELAKANHIISLYRHEQTENTGLIANYEEALGTATEQIRNYCGGIDDKFLAQRKHYNNLLQQEKDEHLQSRLDRDYWHAQTLRVCEMLRTAHRLRMDEWSEEYSVISGLQSEVRCLRRCLGMDVEKPEEETGWPYLKDAPLNDQV